MVSSVVVSLPVSMNLLRGAGGGGGGGRLDLDISIVRKLVDMGQG